MLDLDFFQIGQKPKLLKLPHQKASKIQAVCRGCSLRAKAGGEGDDRIIYKNQITSNKQQVQLMKRPQSAKPGYRAPALKSNNDDIREEEQGFENPNRKQVRLLKPDLTTHDFARIMPKKIHQDKERLYSEGLQLKQRLNEFQQQNIRLRTKITILEKEKERLARAIDNTAESNSKSQSKFKGYPEQSRVAEKENLMLRNMKKIIRESKEENEYLKQENAKIKKAIKFTKINEVEIECKILRDEYKKLQDRFDQVVARLNEQDQYEREVVELKNYLEEEIEVNKELEEEKQQYIQLTEELKGSLEKETEKALQKEKKYKRDLDIQKRRLNEAIKVTDELRKEIKQLKQAPSSQPVKKALPARNITRPMSSNPYFRGENKLEVVQSVNLEAQAKLEEMKKQNQKLEKELREVRQKLEKSQKENKQQPQKAEVAAPDNRPSSKRISQKPQVKSPQKKNLRIDSQPKDDYENEKFDDGFILKESPKNDLLSAEGSKAQRSDGFVLRQDSKIDLEPQYQESFQQLNESKHSGNENSRIDVSKKKIDEHVQNINKDLQEKGVEEELYPKEPVRQKPKVAKQKPKKNAEAAKVETAKMGVYEPNKKILNQIKQLLTYRMKAQRYPPEELEKDIILSKQTHFVYSDLEAMMKTEPFYLNNRYAAAFLEYAFEKKQIGASESISTEVFLKKIKKVIKTFQLTPEQEEEDRLMSIAEMTTKYPDELESAFDKIKNESDDTVAKKDLVEMFRKLELADHFIEIIIAELSVCSEDLDHLSIRGYFQRFYVQDADQDNENPIDEEQQESSGEHQRAKPKIQRIDEEDEYEDQNKAQFLLDNEPELSMRGKGPQPDYNDDIVSDDGHI